MADYKHSFCQQCGESIEFDAELFDVREMRIVTCPHCNGEAVLFVTAKQPAPPSLPVSSDVAANAPPPPEQIAIPWWALLSRFRSLSAKQQTLLLLCVAGGLIHAVLLRGLVLLLIYYVIARLVAFGTQLKGRRFEPTCMAFLMLLVIGFIVFQFGDWK